MEVGLAVVLLAGTLVPALTLMRKGLEYGRDVERRNAMTTLGTSTLEQYAARTMSAWTTGTLSGTYAAQGYSDLRYTLTRSDTAASGGIPARLMALQLTAWHDPDSNGTRNTNESYIVLATKVSRVAGYPL
jgi:hypothetical protein